MRARVASGLDADQEDPLASRGGGRDCRARCALWPTKKIEKKFLVTRAFARRFGTRRQMPQIISTDAIAAELGGWARGYALDQRLSGAKARRGLGWKPQRLDPVHEIALLR
jgi:hypothetical protein